MGNSMFATASGGSFSLSRRRRGIMRIAEGAVILELGAERRLLTLK